MGGSTLRPISVQAARVFIGIVFAWAALAKIGDVRAFAVDVHNFRLVPVALENLVALILPWVELVAALALVLGVRARGAAIVTLALMVVFTLAVGSALWRGLDIECGCFGTNDATAVGARKLVENVLLVAVAWVGALPRATSANAARGWRRRAS